MDKAFTITADVLLVFILNIWIMKIKKAGGRRKSNYGKKFYSFNKMRNTARH
ncbi:MAG: hypothetical protein QM763_14945 [Agriterribacter sp.]